MKSFMGSLVSISSGQRNLMKTYHNDANTSRIPQIALKIFFDFFWQRSKLQKSDFQSHFSMSKIVQILTKKKSLKDINFGQQLLLKSFFDKFNFENNLLLKLGCKIVIFLNLTTLFEKLQKIVWCNFCDSTSISFIVISFHQIRLTWWNA